MTSMTTPKLKKNTLPIAAYSVLTLCCVGFIGGMYYLQYKATHAPVMGFTHPPDPQLVAETEGRKKEKILELRDKWQVWAKGHQPELRAMLKAGPNDFAVVSPVVDAIPGLPTKQTCGIEASDLSGIVNASDPVVVAVDWHQPPKNMMARTPQEQAWVDELRKSQLLANQEAFGQMHDVIVTSAFSAWSKKNYFLWASGRVTENPHSVPAGNRNYKTIAPPYDFLVS